MASCYIIGKTNNGHKKGYYGIQFKKVAFYSAELPAQENFMKSAIICCSLCLLISYNPLFSQQKLTIAVLELDAEGVTASGARVISQRLRSELFQTGQFMVLERDKMHDVLQEQGFQKSGCITNECAVEIGKLIGVQQMLAGSIGKIGKLYTLNVRIIDVESGRVVKTAVDDCLCPIEEILTTSTFEIVKQLAGSGPAKRNDVRSYEITENFSRFYISPLIAHGFTDATQFGFGTRLSHQSESGLVIGAMYIYHIGTDVFKDVSYGDQDLNADSWYFTADIGYAFTQSRLRLTPSLLIGIYDYYRLEKQFLWSGQTIIKKDLGNGLCYGGHIGLDYDIVQNFSIGLGIMAIAGIKGQKHISPYAALNFIF